MNFAKKTIYHLNKCYSIAPLHYNNCDYFLVAAEKKDACLLFDADGNIVETIWESPGGVMSMVQVPGSNGQFLATQQFYSPNDSCYARIVIATPISKNNWDIKTLVELPFVHRFDIVSRNNINYLIACTLKSAHSYKDDWSVPGNVYAAVLPTDLSVFDVSHQLNLQVIKRNLSKNHGYQKFFQNGFFHSLISSEEGVFEFVPPSSPAENWNITKLISDSSSDAVMVDFDADGSPEILTLAPFHGNHFYIYKQIHGEWTKVYKHPEPVEFAHAITGGIYWGKPAAIVGHRKGKRDLLFISFDHASASYVTEIIDHACGSANVAYFSCGDKAFLVSANREIDEISMYSVN